MRRLILALIIFAGCARTPQIVIADRPAAPIMVADQPWEANAIYEPTVLRGRDGRYRMWYSGGWDDAAIGVATSADGVTWAKYPGNPIIGLGRAGISGTANRNHVVYDGGTYYLYFSNLPNIYVATSTDGLNVAVQSDPVLTPPDWSMQTVGPANTFVWKEGSDFYMFFDALGFDSVWRMGMAKGTSYLGPFTPLGGALTTLDRGGAFGAPWILKIGGTYHMWYCASKDGNLPTDIYHATSTTIADNWSVDVEPVLQHDGYGWRLDQVCDPSVILTPDGRLMYYAGLDNTKPTSAIGVSAAAAGYNAR